ncbi:cytochrome P450 family protein [Streptomyces avermitilis]
MAIIDLAGQGPDFYANPYPFYAEMRQAGPVHEVKTPEGDRFWLVVGYDEGRALLADPRLSKSRETATGEKRVIGQHVLDTDPPDHTRLRKLISREFTPRRVAGLEPRIQEMTDELLDAMLPAGRADLVEALAFPLPMAVLCELLGVPHEDRADFRDWTTDILVPPEPAAKKAAASEIFRYLDALIEKKHRSEPTDDLLSALVRTNAEDGDRLTDTELRSMVFILILAGHETTTSLVSNGVLSLLTHPDQLAALRADPSLMDGAVEEMLRFEGSAESATTRFATEPVQCGGKVISPGEMVLVSLAAADRDPARFSDPDTFDIRRSERSGTAGHLAFGHGIHFCLGAPLARLQGRVAIGTLLERCPGLALDSETVASDWLRGIQLRGLRRLPVRW